eukprot:361689-Chlamydomonas_euryale.AAC.9
MVPDDYSARAPGSFPPASKMCRRLGPFQATNVGTESIKTKTKNRKNAWSWLPRPCTGTVPTPCTRTPAGVHAATAFQPTAPHNKLGPSRCGLPPRAHAAVFPSLARVSPPSL